MTPKIQVIICTPFGAIFLTVGFGIHGILSLTFLLLGVTFFSLALAAQLKSHRVHGITDKFANLLSIALFAVGLLGVGEFWSERPQPAVNPHLRFGFASSETNALWLTNDFLMPKGLPTGDVWEYKSGLSNNSPWLIVPITEAQTNAVLQPLLENDSSVDSDDFTVRIALFSEIVSLGNGWRSSSHGDQREIVFDGKFIPKESSYTLPPFVLGNALPHADKPWPAWGTPMIIDLVAKHSDPVKLQFWLSKISIGTNQIKMVLANGNQIKFETNGLIRFTVSKSKMDNP